MAYRLTDKIKAPSRLTAEQAWAIAQANGAARPEFTKALLFEAYRLCQIKGWDFANMFAQMANETGNFKSALYKSKGNPGGIGKTGTDTSTGQDLSITYDTGENAARAMAVHTNVYTEGELSKDDELYQYISLDPRYNAALTAKDVEPGSKKLMAGTVKTLADWNVNGRWAELNNSRYGDNIIERGNELAPNIPNQSTSGGTTVPATTYNYGNGVHPAYEDYPVAESKKFAGYIDPASHIIRAFIIHSAYGYLVGTTGYFQEGNALTDYMVGNSSDGAALDGQLRRFNNPKGARYAWASGPVSSPIDDAAKFLEIYGPNKEVVNMFTTALERSGDSRNAVTDKEHKKRVALIAYWANEYGKYLKQKTGQDLFTCDTFPLIPSENNRSFLIYHGEINADKRLTCPDAEVRKTLDRIIADVKVLLAAWQKGGVAPTDPPVDPPTAYAPPKPVSELQAYKDKDADVVPSYVKVGNDTFIFVSDRVKAKKNTPRYQTANTDGLKIGQDIKKGEEFAVLWMFWDEKDIPWFITPYWTRVLVDDTERIKDEA